MSQQSPEEPDLAFEVQRLKEQVASLVERTGDQDSRIAALELRVAADGQPAQASAPTVPPKPNQKPAPQPAKPAPPTDAIARPAEPTESWGDYLTRQAPVILSRAGIAAVVVGICFAIGYSWQYFGATFKVLAGLAVSGAFVAAGDLVARRKNWGWYGQAITGGGYALAYFVVYAAQNIASVKIVDDPLLAMWGLLGLAGTAMAHALVRRSEAIALFSTLLAFATISLSPVSGFTVLASAILMCGLSFAVVRQRWHGVYGLACAGSYLTYVLFTQPQIELVGGAGGFWLSAGFLTTFWVLWNAVSFRLFAKSDRASGPGDIFEMFAKNPKEMRPRFLFGISLLNGAAFIATSLSAISAVYADSVWLLLAGLGVAYFGTAIAARSVSWNENATVSSFAGLSLLSAAVAIKLDPTATLAVWFLEVPLLVYIGLRNNFRSFRIFALAIGVIGLLRFVLGGGLFDGTPVFDFVLTIPRNVLVGGFASAALGAAAVSYSRVARVGDWGLSEAHFARIGYTIAALGLVWSLTLVQAPAPWVAVILAGESLVLGLAARRFGLATISGAGLLFLLTALCASLRTASHIGLVQIACVLAINFATAAWYRRGCLPNFLAPGRTGLNYLVLSLAGIATGLALTWLKVEQSLLPLVATVEALALLIAGYAARDPLVRASSNVFALSAGICLFNTFGFWNWFAVVPTVAALYAIYAAQRFWRPTPDLDLEQLVFEEIGMSKALRDVNLSGIYALAGTLVLTLSFMSLLNWQHLALALALEGFSLVAAAFLVRDRQFYLSGLAVFALLVGKLGIYDLRNAEPLMRIFSFIASGLVMMAAAYLGGRFSKVFNKTLTPNDKKDDTTPKA